MARIDLRKYNLEDKNILAFPTKKKAKLHKLPYLCWIAEAENRFCIFYVIVRQMPCGQFEVMRCDGTFIEIENKRICGETTYV